MSLFSSSGENGSLGSVSTLLSVILPADDSARASDVCASCVCERARGTGATQKIARPMLLQYLLA